MTICEAGEGAVTLSPYGLPPELVRRLVLRCLRIAAPGASPRGDRLAALVARLQSGGVGTLCGVKARGGDRWRFEAAPPRRRIESGPSRVEPE